MANLKFEMVHKGIDSATPAVMKHEIGAMNGYTVAYWRDKWLSNLRANREHYGPFSHRSLGKLWGILKNQPAIVVGAGPSLKKNVADLKRAREQGIKVLACLHSFSFLHDNGVEPDYYVSVDAAPEVADLMSRGGRETPEYYLRKTKRHILLASTTTHPETLRAWQGDVLFGHCLSGDNQFEREAKAIDDFNTNLSTGGNVLGACFYIAKSIMGANPIIFVGADLAYAPDGQFYAAGHTYDYEKVDKGDIVAQDIFGQQVRTHRAFFHFKTWFDHVCRRVPGIYINATEGGILGAYEQGNLACYQFLSLKRVLHMYRIHDHTVMQCEEPQLRNMSAVF